MMEIGQSALQSDAITDVYMNSTLDTVSVENPPYSYQALNMAKTSTVLPTELNHSHDAEIGWAMRDPTDIPSDYYIRHLRQVESPGWDGGVNFFDGMSLFYLYHPGHGHSIGN